MTPIASVTPSPSGPGVISRGIVEAPVPVLVHGSRPRSGRVAVNTTRSPTAASSRRGNEDAGPGLMSFTR